MRTPESDQQNQQKYEKCGKIVGCDYQGREHKCGCNQGDKMNVRQKETIRFALRYLMSNSDDENVIEHLEHSTKSCDVQDHIEYVRNITGLID